MNILICCAESKVSKKYTSDNSFIRAFKRLGHNVITCGPLFGNYAEDGELKGTKDIRVYDKKTHPETYTYKEILDKCEVKPDLIIQCDPHFYFVGEKPKDIPCAYYIVDVHRGADVFRRMAIEGNFNYVFIAHKLFMPIFQRKGLNTYWLPRAYDDEFIREYPEIEIKCDISFIGETGLSDELKSFPLMDEEIGVRYHEGSYPNIPHERRYRSWDNHSMEYAERAEILIRLSRDYNLRVYEDSPASRGPNYSKIINRGKIVVNHSLWKDSALRNFEVLASKRGLIADRLPSQDELLCDSVHYASYNQYFLPFLSNFDLEYEEIKFLVDFYLKSYSLKHMILRGMHYVETYHTFKNRANSLIDTVFNNVNGYQMSPELMRFYE